MPDEGDGYWNSIGGVRDASQREEGWGDGEEFSSLGEVSCMSRWDASWREERWVMGMITTVWVRSVEWVGEMQLRGRMCKTPRKFKFSKKG